MTTTTQRKGQPKTTPFFPFTKDEFITLVQSVANGHTKCGKTEFTDDMLKEVMMYLSKIRASQRILEMLLEGAVGISGMEDGEPTLIALKEHTV